MDPLHEGGVRVQRIGSVDPAVGTQTGEECLSNGNLVGFLSHPYLQERFLTLMGTERQEMRRCLSFDSGSPHGFAIQGDWFIVLDPTTRLKPGAEGHFQVRHREARQETAIQGTRGGVEVALPKDPLQEDFLVSTPLTDSFQRIAGAEQGSDQTDQQVGQLVAQAMPRAGIRDDGKHLIQTHEGHVPQQG
jgi:hypothetical protein